MTLIKSISGIRGTIGGVPGDNLTPVDITKFSAAFARMILESTSKRKAKIVIGRDARVSGPMVAQLVSATLNGMGIDVVDLGLCSTPTTEMAVVNLKADGGVILTASHNPAQWNALKLLNNKGEFISANDGSRLLELVEKEEFTFTSYEGLGEVSTYDKADEEHLQQILALELVDKQAIAAANFKVAVDSVNSVGGIVIPKLLKALGVKQIIELNSEPTGIFAHNPEPLPENLTDLADVIKAQGADLGLVVDPDVDRLAILNEDGTMFGEEYTLVAVADYILSNKTGNTVSNLSSSLALKDITEAHGAQYNTAAVGEVNVVAKMKETNAIIGGEGNGGIIYPELHYGRDSLVGIALFLTQLAESGKKCSELRAQYPNYVISKNKIELTPDINVDAILAKIQDKYKAHELITIDGVKIVFDGEWVHLRKSNTEPIIRIYSESSSSEGANKLAEEIKTVIREMV